MGIKWVGIGPERPKDTGHLGSSRLLLLATLAVIASTGSDESAPQSH